MSEGGEKLISDRPVRRWSDDVFSEWSDASNLSEEEHAEFCSLYVEVSRSLGPDSYDWSRIVDSEELRRYFCLLFVSEGGDPSFADEYSELKMKEYSLRCSKGDTFEIRGIADQICELLKAHIRR